MTAISASLPGLDARATAAALMTGLATATGTVCLVLSLNWAGMPLPAAPEFQVPALLDESGLAFSVQAPGAMG